MTTGHRRHLLIASALVLIGAVVAYIILEATFLLPPQASAEAESIDNLFRAHFIAIAAIFSLIVVFLLYSLVAFRRRDGDEGDGEYIHGNTKLEIAWTALPIFIVLGFSWWAGRMLIDITDLGVPDGYTIEVDAFKWGWRFYYPELDTETSTLYMPKDVPVVLKMRSDDIIHSMWIPEFRVKQDVLPGRDTFIRYTPTMTSDEIAAMMEAERGVRDYEVRVRCAEICGTRHSQMYALVEVLPNMAEFEDAVVNSLVIPDDPVERGALWYEEFGCNQCHSLDGTLEGYSGPSWLGIWMSERRLDTGEVVVADEEYIRNSIYQPNLQIVEGYVGGVMPQNFEEQFAQKHAEVFEKTGLEIDIVDDLIAFMQTLTEE